MFSDYPIAHPTDLPVNPFNRETQHRLEFPKYWEFRILGVPITIYQKIM